MADVEKMASAVQLFNNCQAVQVENETGRAEYVTGRYLPLNKTVVMARLNLLKL